uniref:Uncharacterized protein n=1 Tax=Helianthus annuus TaxID=4232 RepID=A0A251V4K8_HELAN
MQDSRRLIYLNERLREKALEKKPKIWDILKANASFQQSISGKTIQSVARIKVIDSAITLMFLILILQYCFGKYYYLFFE